MNKNLLTIFTLSKLGLVVKFVDDRCTVHDLSLGDTIVASRTLFCEIYKLYACKKRVEILACIILDSKAISDAKYWHAHFCHPNFANLLHLQKPRMVAS